MPEVRRIIRRAAANEYRMSAFLNGVIDSAPFRMARPPGAAADSTLGAPDRSRQ
jgi:hypothetical protein